MKSVLLTTSIFVFIFSAIIPFSLFCASEKDQPENVYSVIYVQKPNEWYVKQADLWKTEIDRNPKNAVAWRNYYNAVRYAKFTETIHTKEKRQKLSEIIDDMGKAIPNSYTYYFLKHKNDAKVGEIEFLEKAFELDPDQPELYSDFVGHYEYVGNEKKMREFLEKWYHSRDMAPGLLHYNYNVLMSTSKNAILFTNGDNDTYPVWMLQRIKNVRSDVTVLNTSLMMADKQYLERKLMEKGIKVDYGKLPAYRSPEFAAALGTYITEIYPDVPVYYALTVYEKFIESIKENLYIVGLAYKYSKERIDNKAVIKKNINNFRLDYLKYDWYSEDYLATSLMDKLNLNYVAGMVNLTEHYHESGEDETAKYWAEEALYLAKKTGFDDELMKDFEKKGIRVQ
ncbi:MAG: hypothetical protein JSW33_12075 [bacterium]|nr:MAG: hypothetical protein JSW33_12075 [bacterium]